MSIKKQISIGISLLLTSYLFSQKKDNVFDLDTVVISSSRIDIPFKENSRTILVITSKQIQQSAVTNIADLLQQVAGVDIRRRGVSGMQADLYIQIGRASRRVRE